MQRSIISCSVAVTALVAVTLSGPAALAKGGQDNFEGQARLEAELEKARKANAEQGPGLFDLLFGTQDSDRAEAAPEDKSAGPEGKTN